MFNSKKSNEINVQALQEELERKYGPAVAQDIADHIRTTGPVKTKTPDYMDIKAMSELAERFRAQAMMSVWRLKDWRRKERNREAHANLIRLEGAFLQRQCEDAITLYRQANKSYFSMYNEAMSAFLPSIPKQSVRAV